MVSLPKSWLQQVTQVVFGLSHQFTSAQVASIILLSFQIIPQLLPIILLLLQICNEQKHNTQGKAA